MYYTDDPERDFARHDAEQAREEASLPHCDYCGEAIYESYYYINGETICKDCMDDSFKRYVD